MKKRPAHHALQLLRSQQWAITAEALKTMEAIAERTNLSPEMLESVMGMPLENTENRVTVRDGIATIAIRGPLFRYANFFTRISGATAYATVARDFAAALSNPQVKSIILDVDSPGGEVNGCAELAGMIYEARGTKPITAYVSGAGCSAAYWIASAADEIVASDTAIIGSIGCIFTFFDTKGAERQMGIRRIEIVSSQSPKKALDPTQEEGRAEIQTIADDLAQVFVDAVARNRGVDAETVIKKYGQGSVMVGEVAVAAGLADRLGAYETLLGDLRDEVPDESTTETLMKLNTKETAPAAENAVPATAAAPATEATPSPASATPAAPPAEETSTSAAGASEAPAAVATAEAETPDPAARERTRVLAIQALGRPGEEKIVADCVADPKCTVEAAALKLRSAETSAGNTHLASLRGDETSTQAPRPLSPDATDPSSARAIAQSVLEVHARVITPNRSRA